MQVTARRIARLERELRTIERALTGHQDAPPAGGLRAEQLRAERAVAEIQLAGDRSVLEQARAAGGFGQWSRDTLHVGDRVQIHGEWRRIVRINVKTVSVDSGYSWVSRHGFDEITQAACPHSRTPDAPEAQAGAARSPKPRRSTRQRAAGVSRADTPVTTCADGAVYVQITFFQLAGPAVRLVCGCGGKHWSRALDGSPTTAADVPTALVEGLIAAEGYQVSGDWADHKITGEWAHIARRAPVRRFIQPGDEPSVGAGERLHHWRADRWSLFLADGSGYEISWVPEGPDHFLARRRRSTSLGAAPSWAEALLLIRAHAAQGVPDGEGRPTA
ncbi:hypothetical protein DWB77_00005 [Streptomyces hundungensis]|uniref:Uncharacterized protein n=1 Tax=Streptomyces hundungensis TaxID=1077946 RepID=A0A387HB87_9ACTN|nr:hypothetical protein DWB77_00005 [Streptomyces hundungensis]